MLRILRFGILFVGAAITLASTAQTTREVAPVPPQIGVAKKVFVSNAGYDSTSLAAFGDPNEPYNRFYAAMKSWGRYELVSTPAEADLVFELRFTATLSGSNSIRVPQLSLTILDARTHFILWGVTEPIEGAFRKATWDKNFDRGVASLINNLKYLVNRSGRTAASNHIP